MSKRKKVVASTVALVMVVVLALTGTFAWQSISQTAKNEKSATINPGGRLHDDFNGVDKRVYVENFTDTATGTPIFARIRLDEYMEYGENAALKPADQGYADRVVTVVTDDGATKDNRDDVTTWHTRLPGDTTADNSFMKYWNWSFGGNTMYMPTFDKDKDSLDADINGTWTYTDANTGDWDPYGDYVDWATTTTKTADEYYDNDTDDLPNDHTDPNGTNYRKVADVEHFSTRTLGAEMVTMEDWLKEVAQGGKGGQAGNFWVWDADGWAYWANPINPGEATGMFLSRIEPNEPVDDSWYYGINVVAQFVTADDVGWKADVNGALSGFYKDNAEKPSAEAEQLLATIGAQTKPLISKVEITAPADSITAGQTLDFAGAAKAISYETGAEDATESAKITWTVLGSRSDTNATQFAGTVLTVGADEKASNLTVVATYKDHGVKDVTATYIIKVTQPVVGP